MVDADKHKINCWVPEYLWQKVESLGYDNPTKATIAGYEALITKKIYRHTGRSGKQLCRSGT
jgi:hypothetical protein